MICLTVLKALLLLCLWGSSLRAAAVDYRIEAIILAGNSNTRDEVLFRELSFSAGMLVSGSKIEQGRKAIMALGLFNTVDADLRPSQAGHRLLISVQEKQFFLLVPVVNLSGDGDWTYGITSRADNLLGLNQELSVSLKRKRYHKAAIEHENRLQINYRAPRVADSRFGVELGLHSEIALLDEQRQNSSGRYKRRLSEGKIIVSTPLNLVDASAGWIISLGLQRQAYRHTLLSGDDDLFFNADVYTLITRVDNKKITLIADQPKGWHYGYELRRTTTAGSVIYQHLGFYHIYQRLNIGKRVEIHSRVRAGACSRSVFGDPCFRLGGEGTIRGIRRGSLKGDSFILCNTQLLVPLSSEWPLKGTAFLDIGATSGPHEENPTKALSAGVGIGIVWKLRRFVRTDIRLEVARGVGPQGKNRIYGATSMLF